MHNMRFWIISNVILFGKDVILLHQSNDNITSEVSVDLQQNPTQWDVENGDVKERRLGNEEKWKI